MRRYKRREGRCGRDAFRAQPPPWRAAGKADAYVFGAKEQYASTRGVDIAPILVDALNAYKDRVEVLTDTVCTGIYEDGVVTALYKEERYIKLKPKAIIIAAGASEKTWPL